MSEFDKHQESILSSNAKEGLALELHHYLGMMQHNVKEGTDIVEWWQVSVLESITHLLTLTIIPQNHAPLYPTLVQITLNVL